VLDPKNISKITKEPSLPECAQIQVYINKTLHQVLYFEWNDAKTWKAFTYKSKPIRRGLNPHAIGEVKEASLVNEPRTFIYTKCDGIHQHLLRKIFQHVVLMA
jgi:hypothetical protein